MRQNRSGMQELDNIVWNALNGPHAAFAAGSGGARRYVTGFPPIVGFADPEQPDFASLAGFCAAGESFYMSGWSGSAPPGWMIEDEAISRQMVWDKPMPEDDNALSTRLLSAADVPQAMELVTLTQPGPFGTRTIELGDYLGLFDGSRLVAMAGERMAAGRLREISGVCTHPDFRGRGYARRLVLALVRRQLQRGEVPFLQVMRDNGVALRLYERIGMRAHQETVVRVVRAA